MCEGCRVSDLQEEKSSGGRLHNPVNAVITVHLKMVSIVNFMCILPQF